MKQLLSHCSDRHIRSRSNFFDCEVEPHSAASRLSVEKYRWSTITRAWLMPCNVKAVQSHYTQHCVCKGLHLHVLLS